MRIKDIMKQELTTVESIAIIILMALFGLFLIVQIEVYFVVQQNIEQTKSKTVHPKQTTKGNIPGPYYKFNYKK